MMEKKNLKLYCFSPPVMLATFTIEILFAIYTLWRYKLTKVTRLITAILVFLAIFQGSEFAVCGHTGATAGLWSRFGYGAITILPPLGLHLAYTIADKKSKWLVPFAYATCAAFLVYFVVVTDAITGHTCYANYAVFDTHKASSRLYALYYYGWLLIGTFLSWKWTKDLKKRQQAALYALSIGYLSFLVPTTTVNLVNPSTISGIPSIMCGFAVILAFVLVGKVAPESSTQRKIDRVLKLKLPL